MPSLTSPSIQKKLKKIKLLILDVDGILTDGRIFWLKDHGWTRHFHVKDGYGIKLLMAAGIDVAIISGGNSQDVITRMAFLKIKHVFLGDEDKAKALEKVLVATGLKPEQAAFMGDDLFDIPVLEKVGFAATVPHAVDAVKKRAHFITRTPAGWGAVREIADAIRKSQKLGPYLT